MPSESDDTIEARWRGLAERLGVDLPRDLLASVSPPSSRRHVDDLLLALAAADRLPRSWDAIAEDYEQPVTRILARGPVKHPDPADLWMESFRRLLSEQPEPARRSVGDPGRRVARIGGYRGECSLLSFILVVARNVARDAHKRSVLEADRLETISRRPENSTNDADPESAPREPMQQLLASLTEDERRVAGLLARGVRQRQIAALLETTDTRITRIKQRIGRKIAEQFPDLVPLVPAASEDR